MNNKTIWIAAVAVAVALAFALGWQRFAAAPPRGNLAGSGIGGPFALVDQDGRATTDRDFAGRWRLMYFGYTSCPDVCPTDVGTMAKGLKQFAAADREQAAKVAAIFVTVDPRRDTPAAMKAFVRAFSPDIIGLTGSDAQVAAVLKAYRIYAARVPGTDADHYLMNHVAIFYLFDPDGAPVAFLPHGAGAAEIAALLQTHVR